MEVRSRAQRALQLFQEDRFHPSLHFKRIDDEEDVWSAWIGLGYRALSLREDDRVTWFWIGSHAEYNRKV